MSLRRVFQAGCAILMLAATARGGVLVHYTFDADFTDSSGNGNDGVLFDTNTLGNAYITNTAAEFGAGGFFKGDSPDYVGLTTPFTPGTADTWTISFWATLSGGAASPVFSATNTANYMVMRADVYNGVFLKIGGQAELMFPVLLGQNSFHQYTLVANGSGQDLDGIPGADRIVLYVDGVAIAPSNGYDTTTYNGDVLVDAFGYSTAWPYGCTGNFDEFWILNDALASNRVYNLYANNSPNFRFYVDDGATGANSGTTWANAYTNLQETIVSKAIFGDEIWVAAGLYYPDGGSAYADNDRAATFALYPGLKLVGGFAGTETNINQRNIAANLTVLSGDLDQNDATNAQGVVVANPYSATTGSNSYHVVRMVGTDSNSVLDGFTITSGRADGVTEVNGGGLFSQFAVANVRNCTFSGNYADYNGGGIFGSDGTMVVSNCTLIANYGGRGAGGSWNVADAMVVRSSVVSNTCPSECGGLFIQTGALRVEHSVISGNHADSGGGLYQQGDVTSIVVNCLITGNRADGNAGAARMKSGIAVFVNCTIAGNSAPTWGALRNEFGQTSYVYNCIFWDNAQDSATNTDDSISNDGTSSAEVLNSIVQRSGGSTNWNPGIGVDQDGNEDKDPLFITPLNPATAPNGNGNFRITYGSPAINSGFEDSDLDEPGPGTNTAASIQGDLDGSTRLVGTIDMGAYEFLDSDADQLSDWQEIHVYGSYTNDTDSDNDGMDDGDEAYSGTELTNAASFLGLNSTRLSGTNGVIAWASASNRTYRLWRSTNLVSGTWANLGVYTSTPPQNVVTNAPGANSAYYLIGVE